MKSKTYAQNKQPSDKTQSSKFCQLGVKRTRFQTRKKKGNDFFDRSTNLSSTKICLADKVCTLHKAKIKQLFDRIEGGSNRFLKKLWCCVSLINVAWWWAQNTSIE